MQIKLLLKPQKTLIIPKSYNYQLQGAVYSILKEAKKLRFYNNVELEIRSPVFDFIDTVQRSLELRPYFKLFDTRLDVVSAELTNRHLKSGNICLNAVTPVTVHTTAGDGTGHTRYFTPEEDEFYIRLCNNAQNNYEAIMKEPAPEVYLRPAGSLKHTVAKYKPTNGIDFCINGYSGKFEINTTVKMAEFIYNTGLGERNPEGFGFVKIP